MCQTLRNATQNTALPNYQLDLLWWAYLLCRRSLKTPNTSNFPNDSAEQHKLVSASASALRGTESQVASATWSPGGPLVTSLPRLSSLPLLWFPSPRGFLIHGSRISSSEEARKEKKNTRRKKKGATFSFVAQDKRFCFVPDKSLVAQESTWIYTCFGRLLSEMSAARRRTVSTKMTDFRFWQTMWRHTKSREFITQEQKRLECWWTGESHARNDQWTGRPSSFPGSFPYSTTRWGSDWDPSPAN